MFKKFIILLIIFISGFISGSYMTRTYIISTVNKLMHGSIGSQIALCVYSLKKIKNNNYEKALNALELGLNKAIIGYDDYFKNKNKKEDLIGLLKKAKTYRKHNPWLDNTMPEDNKRVNEILGKI